MRQVAAYGAMVLALFLSACAAPGTRVSTNSDFYKSTSKSQQGWCSQFGCNCYLDGAPASCPLVSTCLNAGSCQRSDK